MQCTLQALGALQTNIRVRATVLSGNFVTSYVRSGGIPAITTNYFVLICILVFAAGFRLYCSNHVPAHS